MLIVVRALHTRLSPWEQYFLSKSCVEKKSLWIKNIISVVYFSTVTKSATNL